MTKPSLHAIALAYAVTIAACTGQQTRSDTAPSSSSTAPPATTAPPPSTSAATSPDGSSPSPPPGPSGPPEIRFVGRFDTSDPAGPKAAWPGARILARFDGAAVSVTLKEHVEAFMEGAPSRWDVSIDRGAPRAITMTADGAPHVYELASGLAPGPHEIELYKRTETQNGVTQFLGLDLHGGSLLAPPARQARKIEVIGDSASSGFGIEMLNAPNLDCPGPDHGGAWQNFHSSWGAVLGTTFDAEVHAIVYSGKGVTRNIWRPDTDSLEKYYARANPNPAIAATAQAFDLGSWVPDVIVMKMGANDFAEGLPEPAPGPVTLPEFEAALRAFVVGQLRARAPAAHVFLLVPDDTSRATITEAVTTIAAERAAAGDAKVHVAITAPASPGELVACNAHGTPAYHQRIAKEVAAAIRPLLGW
ncbi:MAG: hypothetical protein JST00_00280 [Deltaproteobacteria bacterium]|nr:hypothetical protein [Deltaproteobacteria bacterium]